MEEESPWKQIRSRTAYENPWIRIREDAVIRPDGQEGIYGVVVARPAVFVVALTEDRKVHLVRLYRYTTSRFSWEVPAGSSDGQELLIAAKRELREETGLAAEQWEEIGSFESLNGVADAPCHVFLARGLSHAESDEQAEEGITEVRTFTFGEAHRMIRQGEIRDSETITTLSIAEIWLESR